MDRFWWFWNRKQVKPGYQKLVQSIQYSNDQNYQLTVNLSQNERTFREIFRNCSDVVFRSIRMDGKTRWLVIYISSLIDTKQLDNYILKSLIAESSSCQQQSGFSGLDLVEGQAIPVGQTKVVNNVSGIVQQILKGYAAVLSAGDSHALIADLVGTETRSIDEPPSEPVIRGPRDGFIENLTTNLGLLRRRLRTPRLKTESCTVGDLTQTDVVISYIEGLASDSLVEEIRKRIKRIQIDGVLESGYIEEFIEDLPFSPFPQVLHTERPDVVVAQLLEGRVAILVDTTPFVLVVPMTFWSALQSSEDYYEQFLFATALRWLRFIMLFIALFLPSLYVAITTFHQEMIPTNLLMSIAAAREPSPFPALVEALLMEVTFEGLREAGVRLPRTVGQSVSIVGALVIGQAAVQAGIVSSPMVIVVSITGIASFTIPRFNFGTAIRLLRFPLIFLGGTLGLYGISIGALIILLHLLSLRSFGTAYFTPFGPLKVGNLKDVFIRVPWWGMNARPRLMGNQHLERVPEGQKPNPPKTRRGTGAE